MNKPWCIGCSAPTGDRLTCEDRAALPPVRSDPLLGVAKRLRDAWSMIDNALDGLAMRGEKDSPLVRDLREAQAEVETSRQVIYVHTSNAEAQRSPQGDKPPPLVRKSESKGD